eukprot:763000-Hanusia_phi.AAC.1
MGYEELAVQECWVDRVETREDSDKGVEGECEKAVEASARRLKCLGYGRRNMIDWNVVVSCVETLIMSESGISMVESHATTRCSETSVSTPSTSVNLNTKKRNCRSPEVKYHSPFQARSSTIDDSRERSSVHMDNSLFSTIPDDAYIHILQNLSIGELALASQVNHRQQRLCSCDLIWKMNCYKDFGVDAEELMTAFENVVDRTCVSYFQALYRKMLGFEIELHFTSGPRSGDVIKIPNGKQISIGRSRKNDICILQDEMVSRSHGQIRFHKKRFWLTDLGSINGTLIRQNGVQRALTKDSPVHLELRNEVEMGNSIFVVELANPSPLDGSEATTPQEKMVGGDGSSQEQYGQEQYSP